MRSTWIFLVFLGSLGVVAEEADRLSAANVALREDRLSSWMEKIRELRGATTTPEQLGPSWNKFAVLAKRLEVGAVPVHELEQAIEVRKSFADRLYFASFDEAVALHEELIETFTGGGLESKQAFFRRCRDEYLSAHPNYFDNRPPGEWYDTLQKRTACYIMMHHTVGLCGALAMEPEDR
jgi:hypothetical protein